MQKSATGQPCFAKVSLPAPHHPCHSTYTMALEFCIALEEQVLFSFLIRHGSQVSVHLVGHVLPSRDT